MPGAQSQNRGGEGEDDLCDFAGKRGQISPVRIRNNIITEINNASTPCQTLLGLLSCLSGSTRRSMALPQRMGPERKVVFVPEFLTTPKVAMFE